MKKNLFLGVMAATMLFATSCQKEEDLVFSTGENAMVSFSVSTPEIATRAFSDGTTATKLQYAVYDEAGNILSDLTKTDGKINISTTVNLQLTTGNTYSVIFWAASPDAPYTVDFGAKTMTVDYAKAVSNDETRDAFYKYHEFTVKGAQTETIELKRPFAQLNIGTSDYAASASAGYTPAYSYVKVPVSKVLNLVDGSVDTAADVEFKLAAIPQNEKFPVSGYDYLSMNYLLVPAAKEVVEVTFGYSESNQTVEKTRTVGSVPVQRNYRTNIYGQLLTSDVDINVIIEPEYDGEDNLELPYVTIGNTRYTTFGEAMAAVQDGETIKLQGGAIELEGVANGSLFTIADKNITIDLNNYDIVANIPDVTKNSAIFYVTKTGKLTIEGEGNIKVVTAKADNCLAAFINNDGGTVNLKGGNWTMTALAYPDALIPTFVDNNSNVNSATLNIYGGTYTFHRNLFRNFANAASHNNNATVATMNIYGGTFNGIDGDAGAIWNQKPSANTPAGAGVINLYGGEFNNVNIDDDFATVVTNATELAEALKNPEVTTIELGAGEFTLDTYSNTSAKSKLNIIGTEGTKVAFSNLQVRAELYNQFTVHNCEIVRMPNKSWGHLVFGSSNKADGVYTISNCTFNGVGSQGIYINEEVSGATYNIVGCTFNGDFGGEGAITIQNNTGVNHIVNVKGCTFNNIPSTSHKIYVIGDYEGFTLNSENPADVHWGHSNPNI